MKLILENIGKIKKAEIDLDHQLTVFFGPNNTGKTYVSYCLYGLSRRLPFGEEFKEADNVVDINIDPLFENGEIEIDLVAVFLHQRNRIRKKYIEAYVNFLPELFGNYAEGQFSTSFVSFSFFEDENLFREFLINSVFSLRSHRFNNEGTVFFKKMVNGILNLKTDFSFNYDFKDGISKKQVIDSLKRNILESFSGPLRHAFFVPAERIGVSVFGKELILDRFSQTNLPNKNAQFTPYSLPVFEAIRNQFQMANLKGRKSGENFLQLAIEIEKEILGGALHVNESGDVFYGYDDKNILSILNSASTIKSLASLVFYLRYFAISGQSLFIDEPEINLHPENQIKIARILAKIANQGIKVYVSTHSDYIIREFNNLMMLGKDDPEKKRLMEEYGYKNEEILDYNKVGAYFFNLEGYPKQVEVKETGFEVETIDETINNQNRASNDIRWTLFDE